MIYPREKPEFLNLLCKTCHLKRSLPRSMLITCLQNVPTLAEYRGGFADVYRGKCDGHPVAIKVVRLCTTDNAGLLLSVGTRFPYTTEKLVDHVASRGSAEKLSHGDTYDTQMFCPCLARRWMRRGRLGLGWCRNGWAMAERRWMRRDRLGLRWCQNG
jgi:hypothetical protein